MEEYVNREAVQAAMTKAQKDAAMSYTHDEVVDLIREYIKALPTENVNELKTEVADLRNRLHLIWAIGHDYDGCNRVESLKELIDELVSYTQLPREQVPDITSRTGRWVRVLTTNLIEDPDRVRWKCSSCGRETDLPNYEKANYCFNCGAKMVRE